ncbi:D-alanyl-D-alanine carboxypeptidase family protein [Oceanobacillus massiliensis]|uniref:D-alanyl-D-alanine carboxypeptidase family protein n=1 Tax=Oceanobacillus massiliensis TaxID=1465765 RepID=UPI00028970AC|nr:D-alanyl-D-alanine carboxypeptidase family protein [Oceanobacillus massiliensis]
MRKIILFITTIVAVNSLFGSKAFGEPHPSPPSLESEAAILLERNSGQVLFDKNANSQMYPASVTKIATAIYAIETGNLDDIVTISSNARAKNVEGTTVYLEEGEKVTLKELIQGLLINSGNDAGVAIAEHLNGSEEQFSKDINTYLKNVIGVQDTNFENPHGLFNSEHRTTAEDLARITRYAMKNETFREIFGTKELEWNGQTWDTTILSHHKLVKEEIPYKGVTGGKNGYVNQSGYTLATTAERDGLSLIVITLKGSMKNVPYDDTIKLLDYGFENYRTSIISKGTKFKVEDQEYTASETIAYTHPKNEQLSKDIKEDGTMEIIAQDGEVAASYQLEEVSNKTINVKTKLENTTTNKVRYDTIFDELDPYLAYFSIAFLLSMIGIFYRQNIYYLRKIK